MADTADVVIVGGGLGGVAAAVAAASTGLAVLLIEETAWLGGQLTAQGVCTPDEAGINGVQVDESCGVTDGYKDLKHRIREYYRTSTTLSAAGAALNPFNAGGCWVNYGFAVEPLVGLQILQQIVAEQATLTVWMQSSVVGSTLANGAISSLTVQKSDGTQAVVIAAYYLDATETGELLLSLGLQWTIGAESASATGEPDAPADAQPTWIQPITYPFALTYRTDGGDYTIAKPDNYDAIKAQQGFTIIDGDIKRVFGQYQFWTYRRVIDQGLFNDPNYKFDVATINVGANDFKGPAYPTGDTAQDQQILQDAQAASRCFLYWLQTEVARDDGSGDGYPELMPNTAFWGTGDYVSPAPYIRESRRISAVTTIKQQDIDADFNQGPRARAFPDSCGIGNYVMDVHQGIPAMPQIENATKPYQIPTGALIPKDCSNLLASCKNIGTTHITNGSYRLHPQEWNIGESAGALAAFCVQNSVQPSQVVGTPALLTKYQVALTARGIPLFWWTDVTSDMPNFGAIHLAGVNQIFSGDPNSLSFRPNDPFTAADQQAINDAVGQVLPWPAGALTRSEAALFVAQQLQLI